MHRNGIAPVVPLPNKNAVLATEGDRRIEALGKAGAVRACMTAIATHHHVRRVGGGDGGGGGGGGGGA